MSNKDKFLTNNSIKDDITREPSGSLQPMTANDTKWFGSLNAKQLDRLSAIADEVMETADDAVTKLVRAKMKIGRLLNEARVMFPGDLEFGKWRKSSLPDISTTETTYCMKIESTFGSAPELIESMGWSTMRELSYAPTALIDKLKADPTAIPANKKDAREAVKEANKAPEVDKAPEPEIVEGDFVPASGGEDEPAEITGTEGMPEDRDPKPIKVGITNYAYLTIDEKWMYYLSLSLKGRLKYYHEHEDPFIVFGLSPDTEICMVSMETMGVLKRGLLDDPELNDHEIGIINNSAKAIEKMTMEGMDKTRELKMSIRASHEREMEE